MVEGDPFAYLPDVLSPLRSRLAEGLDALRPDTWVRGPSSGAASVGRLNPFRREVSVPADPQSPGIVELGATAPRRDVVGPPPSPAPRTTATPPITARRARPNGSTWQYVADFRAEGGRGPGRFLPRPRRLGTDSPSATTPPRRRPDALKEAGQPRPRGLLPSKPTCKSPHSPLDPCDARAVPYLQDASGSQIR